MSAPEGCMHEWLKINNWDVRCSQRAIRPRSGYRTCARERTGLGWSRWSIACISCGLWSLWKSALLCLHAHFFIFQFSGRCRLALCSLASLAAIPYNLTFCKLFCFGEWKECIYLAVLVIWVATAKQRNHARSQKRRAANNVVLDKYQLSELVLLTPRPGSVLPSFHSETLKNFKFFFLKKECWPQLLSKHKYSFKNNVFQESLPASFTGWGEQSASATCNPDAKHKQPPERLNDFRLPLQAVKRKQ